MAYPFLGLDTKQASSGGQVSLTYQVPTNKRFTIKQIMFASDGTFNVVGISSSRGSNYTNASNSKPLPSTLLPFSTNAYNMTSLPIQDLVLEGGDEFTIVIVDTSAAANDVWMLLNGMLEDK